mgnify:CR=1 FL=1
MDDREISEYIKRQCDKYHVKEVGYDAYNAASMVARLHDYGIPVKKVGQGMAVLNNPSKYIEKLILSTHFYPTLNNYLILNICIVF